MEHQRRGTLGYCQSICVALIVVIGLAGGVLAQPVITKRPVTDGREFLVCFHSTVKLTGELLDGTVAYVELFSTQAARVVVTSAAALPDAPPIFATIQLEPNTLFLYRVHQDYADLRVSEYRNLGIRVSSDVPISVSTQLTTPSTSERVRHIPLGWWGTRYRSANYWLDELVDGTTSKYLQSNIVIVSNHDSTFVTVNARLDVQAGPSVQLIPKNTDRTFVLNKGQLIVLKNVPIEGDLRKSTSDLSGSLITSNKPVGVISGHDLVATQRFPSSLVGVVGASMRNTLAEAIIPASMFGTTFITAPMFNPRPIDVASPPPLSLDQETGDAVVIIADQAGTLVQRRGVTGAWTDLGVLNAGEAMRIPNVVSPAQWQTSLPVLMIQCTNSKAYTRTVNSSIMRVKAAMALVTDVSRWTDQSTFGCSLDNGNAVTVVVPTTRTTSLEIDGTTMVGMTGVVNQVIPQSEYSTLQLEVPAGYHRVVSTNGTSFTLIQNSAQEVVSFLPALSMASATNINYATTVSGGLALDTVQNGCSKTFRLKTTGESKLMDLFSTVNQNVDLVVSDSTGESVTYTLSARSRKRDGRISLVGRCDNGSELSHTVLFASDLLQSENSDNIFNDAPVGDTIKISIELENLTEENITVTSMDVVNENGNHEVWPIERTFTINSKSKRMVEFYIAGSAFGVYTDSVHFNTACSRSLSVQFRGAIVSPKILASEKSWSTPPNNQWTPRWVGVTNPGSVVLKIKSYTFDGIDTSKHFRYEDGLLPLPMVLQPGETREFKIGFNPKGKADSTFNASVTFHSTAVAGDSVSVLTGVSGPGVQINVSEDYSSQEHETFVVESNRPLVIESGQTFTYYRLYSLHGELLWESVVNAHPLTIAAEHFNHAGLFVLRIDCHSGTLMKLIVKIAD